MGELEEMLKWYTSLDPTFRFLFALPFILAAAGLLSYWWRGGNGE